MMDLSEGAKREQDILMSCLLSVRFPQLMRNPGPGRLSFANKIYDVSSCCLPLAKLSLPVFCIPEFVI